MGAAAVLGGAAAATALTLCEEQKNHSNSNDNNNRPSTFKRMVTKQGLADPMTTYQQHALEVREKELEEEAAAGKDKDPAQHKEEAPESKNHQQHKASLSSSSSKAEPASVQATSADSSQAPNIKPNIKTFPTEMTESEARLEESARKAKQHSGGIKIFSGNGNMSLALEIVRHLGISLGKATVGRFADGEVNVVINENVRGKDVYIVQPTCPPVNDNIMELLLMVSTLRRASARRITVVIPYYGYARQDRKMQARY